MVRECAYQDSEGLGRSPTWTDSDQERPTTLYLAYLGQNKLYFDALRLLNSSYFEKEIDFKVTRDHVWNQLIPQH